MNKAELLEKVSHFNKRVRDQISEEEKDKQTYRELAAEAEVLAKEKAPGDGYYSTAAEILNLVSNQEGEHKVRLGSILRNLGSRG